MDLNKTRKNFFLIPFLFAASLVYGFITNIRNYLYNTGIFKTHNFDVPIISVGNITAGGTGKTPFVIYLLEKLITDYHKIVVVSRGYGRKSRGLQIVSDGQGNILNPEFSGDEPVLIAKKFHEVPVIVSEKRRIGIESAIKIFNATLVLLDDAFQHRSVARDCDVVLVNANQPIQSERMLPSGDLRENKNNLNRADIIVLSKTEDKNKIDEQKKYYENFDAELYVSTFSNAEIVLVNSYGNEKTEKLKSEPSIAFCGIAQPDSFEHSLNKIGINLKTMIGFPDHKSYLDKDIEYIINKAKQQSCTNIITTEKDWVKLDVNHFEGYNLFVLKIKLEVENEEALFKKVKNCIDLKM